MPDTTKTDAELMKQMRTLTEWSQQEAAREIGYNHKNRISAIENGRKGLSGPARKLVLMIIEEFQ